MFKKLFTLRWKDTFFGRLYYDVILLGGKHAILVFENEKLLKIIK